MIHMHKIKALVIQCIDFRFQTAIREWLEDNGYENEHDLLSIAGSSKDIVKPAEPSHSDFVLRNIKTSIRLHGPEGILLFDHQDCGGYAADGTILSGMPREKDLELHKKFLKEAKRIIEGACPGVRVRLFYVDLEMKVEEIF